MHSKTLSLVSLAPRPTMPVFVDPKTAESYECNICGELIDQAVQADACSHIYCAECINKLRANRTWFPCPSCRKGWDKTKITRCLLADQQIRGLLVRCPNSSMTVEKQEYLKRSEGGQKEQLTTTSKIVDESQQESEKKIESQQESETAPSINDNNKTLKRQLDDTHSSPSDPPLKRCKVDTVSNVLCDWTGELRNEEDHVKVCPFALIPCKFCGDKFLRRDLEQHHTQCLTFPMTCGRCHKRNIPRSSLADHWARSCPMTETACSLCSATMLQREIPNHLDSQCPEQMIPCPFTGCAHSTKRKEMDQHIDSAAGAHSKMMQRQLNNVLNAMKQIQDSNQQLRDELKRERKESAASIQKLQDQLERERKEMAEFMQNLHDTDQSLTVEDTVLNEQAICLMISDDSESC